MQARIYAKKIDSFADQAQEFSIRLSKLASASVFSAATHAINTYPGAVADKVQAVETSAWVLNNRVTQLNKNLQASLRLLNEAQDSFFGKSLELSARLEGSQELRELARATSEVCGHIAQINDYMAEPGHGLVFQTCGIASPINADINRHIAQETTTVIKSVTPPNYTEALRYSGLAVVGGAAPLFYAASNILEGTDLKSALEKSFLQLGFTTIWTVVMGVGAFESAKKAASAQKSDLIKASYGAARLIEAEDVPVLTDPKVVTRLARSHKSLLALFA